MSAKGDEVNPNQPRLRPYEKPPEAVARHKYDSRERRLLSYGEVHEDAADYAERIPRASAPRLVSSVDGAISSLLFTIPAFVPKNRAYWDVYKDLFARLPEATKLIVLTPESVATEVETWMSEAGLGLRTTVVPDEDGIRFTEWAEDAYLFVRDSSGSGYFVEPCEFRRYGDALIANIVAGDEKTSLRTYEAPLYFQGGNVLVGDVFFLIGEDYIRKTFESEALEFPQDEEHRMRILRSRYREYVDHERALKSVGSRVRVPTEKDIEYTRNGETWIDRVYSGNEEGTEQPIFHIDMFITLAGRSPDGVYTVLVGDPGLAASILRWPVSEYAMTEIFHDIAAQLADDGFRVIRNPLPLVYSKEEVEWGWLLTWYFATSNNALVEVTANGKRVWLPSYGHEPWPELRKTDQANRGIWEDLGFEVVMVGNFHPFAEDSGALHCIKKYISRGP